MSILCCNSGMYCQPLSYSVPKKLTQPEHLSDSKSSTTKSPHIATILRWKREQSLVVMLTQSFLSGTLILPLVFDMSRQADAMPTELTAQFRPPSCAFWSRVRVRGRSPLAPSTYGTKTRRYSHEAWLSSLHRDDRTAGTHQ